MHYTLLTISTILILHFVFDFILQSHYMAANKSKSNMALLMHVVVYTIGLEIMVSLFTFLNLYQSLAFIVINASMHFVTDYITSRKSSKLFNVDWHNFFVVIGLDQLIHYITLFSTLELINHYI
jgi:hypothetical protein